MPSDAEEIHAQVQSTLDKLEPLLHRTEADPRPIVLMTCGVAGSGKSTLSKALLARHPRFLRLSIDAIIASRHGIYGQDYPASAYDHHQDEANAVFRETLRCVLVEGTRDVVLDRSFYARADREEVKRVVEGLGGRWVLAFLEVEGGREELWRRIVERRERGVDADSAREIGEEVLKGFVEGFEVPRGEGEVVVRGGQVVVRDRGMVEGS